MSNYHIKNLEEYFQTYRKSVSDPEGFWEEIAEEHFVWRKRWDKVLDWDFKKPSVKWFEGAQLNITENCIDRHLSTRGDKTAILFEPNDPNEEAQHITYNTLYSKVNKMANVLKGQGVKKGDRVLYLFAHDPGIGLCCIGLCAYWCNSFCGFCRILFPCTLHKNKRL